MTKLVKEGDDVVILHQTRLARGSGKVADQNIFGKAETLLAGGQTESRVMLVLVLPRKHVKVNPTDAVVVVVDVIDGHFRMPNLRVCHRLVRNAIHLAADVENSLQNS